MRAIEPTDPLVILLRLPAPPALLRWHVRLAERLRADGHAVSVKVQPCEPLPGWLGWMRLVERTLYASLAIGENDLLEPVGQPDFGTQHQPDADLCIDCTGAQTALAGLVLRPGVGAGAPELQALDAVLAQRPPQVGWHGAGGILASGIAAITAPHIHSQGVSEALARMISMVGTAITTARAGQSAGGHPARPHAVAGVGRAGTALARTFGERIAATVQRKLNGEGSWRVGWRPLPSEGGVLATARFDAAAFRWLPADPAFYIADPFPYEHEGRRVLFVEQYPYATGRGILSMIELGADGPAGAPIPVVERPFHLSYPGIFAFGGDLWMIPESAGAARLELLRATRFPDQWVLHSVLFENRVIADATFFEHGGRCWLAGATADGGASDRDALSLWHAPHPEGPWTPHPGNPVVVDVANARPGGWLRRVNGRLRRPAQDCTHGYGWGLSLLEIETLTPDSFSERRLAGFPPPASVRATAFHTLNDGAGIETIDAVF